MQELRNFYIKFFAAVAVVIVLGAEIIAGKAIPALEQLHPAGHWSLLLLKFLISRPAIVILIGASEWVIRKKIWRWKWFHPELDFSGTWKGLSTYTDVHVGTGLVPRTVSHEARIEQDCLSIRLSPAQGSGFIFFESTSVNLIDAHRLVYSYHVKYDSTPNFPDETYGYEEMYPIGEMDARGRPIKLNGWFAHCAKRGQTPVYSGTVVFTRT